MLQTVFTVSLAFALTQIKGNLLLVYAVGMTCILCSIQLIMIARASFRFHECRLVFADWFDLARIKQLASFASWNLIGILGSTLRNQGTAILLNIHFGTKVNAAYGISSQLSSATDQLSSAMMGAFSPEITNCEAQGDRKRMLSLAQSANKIGTILILLFAIPLLLEMEFVLTLWLKTPPLHSALFCRLILIMFLIDRLTSGYILAVHAYGRVAAYQTTLGSILVITLPIAWFFIRLGYPSESVGFAFIITMIFCSLGRVVWMKRLFDVSPGLWLWNTVFPCLAVASSSCAVGLLCHQFMIPSFIRLILLCALTLITSGLASCVFALAPEERVFLEKNAGSLLMKARSLSAAFRICY
jgi:O-antigen/teichoic acid export membrane protein